MHQNLSPRARTGGLVTQDLPDEVLIYDLNTHKAHCLNRTAATVWKSCDGKTSVTEITTQMNRDFHEAIDEAIVWQALKQLRQANLLEDEWTSFVPPSRLGRRNAIRQLGLISAVAVPLVLSLVVPTALAGCTFANDQGFDALCCTNAQCNTATLECCDGRCKKCEGQPCSEDSQCCSQNCVGTPSTCQNTEP